MIHDIHPHASMRAGGLAPVVGVLGLALLFLLTGCQKPLYRDQDLANLLDAYRKQETQIRERQRQAVEQRIRRLEIRKTPDGHLVTVDLDRASLAPVIRQILDQSQVPFLVLDDVSLGGKSRPGLRTLPWSKRSTFSCVAKACRQPWSRESSSSAREGGSVRPATRAPRRTDPKASGRVWRPPRDPRKRARCP